MSKKIIFSLVFLVSFVSIAIFSGQEAKAMTASEIQALIQQLQAQIAALQKQLVEQEETPAKWCHDFNKNLRIGDTGEEVKALRTVLMAEGFSGLEAMGSAYEFDEEIASAVVGFQEKYKKEILTPSGLKNGTGFVGKATRAKLNKLYGCGVSTENRPPVISSVDGPSQLLVNEKGVWTINAYDPEGNNLVYFVSWGDGAVESPTENKTFTYSYSQAGIYTIQISVGYKYGLSAKKSVSVNIVSKETKNNPPKFSDDLAIYKEGKAGEWVNFKLKATDPDGDELGWSVDWGDGSGVVSNSCPYSSGYYYGNKPSWTNEFGHIWTKDGTYSVKFTASDCQGGVTPFYVKVFISAATTTPTITVLSPNGGEKWTMGSTQTIKWNSTGFNYVLIDLIRGDGASGSFTSPAKSGQFIWQVPSHLSAANDYKIRIMGIDSLDFFNEAGKSDLSDNYFSIVAAATVQPSISISGSSGSQTNSSALTVNIGDTFTISGIPRNLQGLSYWFGSGYPPIGYYNRAYFFDQTFSNNNSCGNNEASTSGTWTMTCTAKVAGSSNIYIEIYANGQIYKSNVVSVTILPAATPSITVLSPNGNAGEILQEGSNHKINWNALNLPSDAKIHITLFRNDELNMPIVSNLPATQREYTWLVTGSGNWGFGYEYKPSLFAKILGIKEVKAAGIGYQIMVSATWGTYGTNYYGNTYDKSDNYFSIVAAKATYIYPGFFMATDKSSYSSGDTINLKISRADNKTFPYFVDAYIVRQSDDYKYQIAQNMDVTNPTGYLLQTNTNLSVFSGSGNYTLLICAGGEVCVGGTNTNSTAIYYTVVVPSSITVTSPNVAATLNGGIAYMAGATMRIAWSSNGVDKVWLSYLKYPDTTGVTAAQTQIASLSNNPGFYDWPIPASLATSSSYYKIQVASLDGTVSDLSEGYFIIVAGPTSFLSPENQLADISSALGKIRDSINQLLNR